MNRCGHSLSFGQHQSDEKIQTKILHSTPMIKYTLGGLIKLLHHIIDEHFAMIFFRHLGIFATATPFNVLAKDPSLQAPVS